MISKLYCTQENHVAILQKKTKKQKKKHKTNTINKKTRKKQEQYIKASIYITGRDAIMQLL